MKLFDIDKKSKPRPKTTNFDTSNVEKCDTYYIDFEAQIAHGEE